MSDASRGNTGSALRLGAYVLDIRLGRPLVLPQRPFRGVVLAPGRYLYVGSARGPGGLEARLARHRRRLKAKHWHVDWLTLAGRIEGTLAVPGGEECTLAAALRAIPRVSTPVRGFGSSDCRRCPAHLYGVPADLDLAEALGAVSGPAWGAKWSLRCD